MKRVELRSLERTSQWDQEAEAAREGGRGEAGVPTASDACSETARVSPGWELLVARVKVRPRPWPPDWPLGRSLEEQDRCTGGEGSLVTVGSRKGGREGIKLRSKVNQPEEFCCEGPFTFLSQRKECFSFGGTDGPSVGLIRSWSGT